MTDKKKLVNIFSKIFSKLSTVQTSNKEEREETFKCFNLIIQSPWTAIAILIEDSTHFEKLINYLEIEENQDAKIRDSILIGLIQISK